jgi:hypothetical protein
VVIAGQRSSKQISVATNQHETIEEQLEAASSMRSMPRLHSEDQKEKSAGGPGWRLGVFGCISGRLYLPMTKITNRRLCVCRNCSNM